MDTGKPLTTYLVTALILWAVYLWRHNRLGKPGLLPHPADQFPVVPLRPEDIAPPVLPPSPGGWQPGTPPQVTR